MQGIRAITSANGRTAVLATWWQTDARAEAPATPRKPPVLLSMIEDVDARDR
jgi:hypothetical protein